MYYWSSEEMSRAMERTLMSEQVPSRSYVACYRNGSCLQISSNRSGPLLGTSTSALRAHTAQ
ncbi:hypothetical protein BN2476_210143 [Paraburkholderia piptadeniae]|uniref:Uncharacterized protein n=1 Tax=Paraburkholderia piptadeniae TaxID=1701573 RepID=A0A1N7RW34_9BURK|nr:hypothetical protein BN2476_210143 [Paraburkholderia piptadeniae]